MTVAGEWSNGFNDCGLFLRAVGMPPLTTGCAAWEDASGWDQATKDGVKNFALASMDAFQDWYFWTWKVRCGPRPGPLID